MLTIPIYIPLKILCGVIIDLTINLILNLAFLLKISITKIVTLNDKTVAIIAPTPWYNGINKKLKAIFANVPHAIVNIENLSKF